MFNRSLRRVLVRWGEQNREFVHNLPQLRRNPFQKLLQKLPLLPSQSCYTQKSPDLPYIRRDVLIIQQRKCSPTVLYSIKLVKPTIPVQSAVLGIVLFVRWRQLYGTSAYPRGPESYRTRFPFPWGRFLPRVGNRNAVRKFRTRLRGAPRLSLPYRKGIAVREFRTRLLGALRLSLPYQKGIAVREFRTALGRTWLFWKFR